MISNQGFPNLIEKFGLREANNLIKILLEDFFNKKSISDLDSNELNKLDELILRLIKNEPVQYIVGKSYFFGFPFFVNSSVLIPRPETEELTELAIHQIKNSHCKILDIGTGSGCIAITISKKCPNVIVDACDISLEALALAESNSVFHNTHINFFEYNILEKPQKILKTEYDFIISNPPYIPIKEKLLMSQNVKEFEPHLALFVPDETPLIFYAAIFDFCSVHLKTKGSLLLECNEFFAEATLNLGVSSGLFSNYSIYKDLSGKLRMLHFIKS
jgi:release factor glutamine methyltransferase